MIFTGDFLSHAYFSSFGTKVISASQNDAGKIPTFLFSGRDCTRWVLFLLEDSMKRPSEVPSGLMLTWRVGRKASFEGGTCHQSESQPASGGSKETANLCPECHGESPALASR